MLGNKRFDGRKFDELRKITIKRNYFRIIHASGTLNAQYNVAVPLNLLR